MKSVILPVIILLAFAGFASTVQKEKNTKPAPKNLDGSWEGSYSIEGGPFVNPLWFDFDAAKIQVSDGDQQWGDRAAGSYFMEGDTLKAKYRFREGLQEPVMIVAVVKENTIEGNWEWVKGKGKLVMRKKAGTIHRQKTTVR